MGLRKSAASTVKKTYYKALNNYSSKLAGSKKLLYNKYVLYASFAICIINLLIWSFSGEFIHVAMFLLVGYLTSYFSKNMIVILVIALVVSNVFKSGSNIVLEGMTQKKEGTVEGNTSGDGVFHKKEKVKEGATGNRSKDEMDGGDSLEGIEEVDETREGVDDETACKTDTDCKNGQRCNDSGFCASAN
jgi:hypothetical protein